MATVFVPNPLGIAMYARSVQLQAALENVADEIVEKAKTLAPVDEGDYIDGLAADSGVEGTTAIARVNAWDWKSGLIEFGTSDTPTFAVLRKAAGGGSI